MEESLSEWIKFSLFSDMTNNCKIYDFMKVYCLIKLPTSQFYQISQFKNFNRTIIMTKNQDTYPIMFIKRSLQ